MAFSTICKHARHRTHDIHWILVCFIEQTTKKHKEEEEDNEDNEDNDDNDDDGEEESEWEVHGTAAQLRSTGAATTPWDSLRTSSDTAPRSTRSRPPATSRMASSRREGLLISQHMQRKASTHIPEERDVGVAGDTRDYQEIWAHHR